jgi:hypothetical protein
MRRWDRGWTYLGKIQEQLRIASEFVNSDGYVHN